MPVTAAERGFTLIESLLTIVIIGIALSALVAAWASSAVRSADPYSQVKMQLVAKHYFAQLAARNYDEHPACPTALARCSQTLGSEEGRATFDDIDDYQGLAEAVSDGQGKALADFEQYSVEVQVRYAGEDFELPARALKFVELKVIAPDESWQRYGRYWGAP